MKFYRLIAFALTGFIFLVGLQACSTPPKGPDAEQIKKRADEGAQDLRMEEERHKR
ncbi:MAG: hypothetical protein ACREIQ_01890 [Nitrospiria bacterium]